MERQQTAHMDREIVADLRSEPAVRGAADNVIRSIGRHRTLVVLTTIGVALFAWLAAATQPKRYQSEAIASVSPIVNQLSDSEILHGIDALERRVVVATVAALASSDSTRQRTTRSLRGHYAIDGTVLPSTNLIRISVEGPDPKQVAEIANRVPALLDEQTRAMFRVYTIAMISAGAVPEAPFLPRVERAVMAGLVLGVLLGVAVAYLIDRRSLRSAAAQ